MRKFILVLTALAAGLLAAACGSGSSAPATTTTSTSAPTTSAVVYGDAFQLAGPIHGRCTATDSVTAKTATVQCDINQTNRVALGVKVPPGIWKTYNIQYTGTTILPVQRVISKGYLYLYLGGAFNDTIMRVTFTS